MRSFVLAMLLGVGAEARLMVELAPARFVGATALAVSGSGARPSVHMALRGGARGVKASKPGAKMAASRPKVSFAAKQWKAYLGLLETRPIPTKMATAALLSAFGDALAQTLDRSVVTFSVRRLLVLVTINIVYFAPVLHLWYNLFDKIVAKLKLKQGSWHATFTYLALDQLVNAPLTIFGFFAVFTLISAISEACVGVPMPGLGALGMTLSDKVKLEYTNVLVANWKVWVGPQILNFSVVPPMLRVAFANVVAIAWNAILSIIANR